jgi:hypothetical protein
MRSKFWIPYATVCKLQKKLQSDTGADFSRVAVKSVKEIYGAVALVRILVRHNQS